MQFIIARLSRTEAEASRQAYQNNIDHFMSTCGSCKDSPRRGCQIHAGIIANLKDLKRRMQFVDGPSPSQE